MEKVSKENLDSISGGVTTDIYNPSGKNNIEFQTPCCGKTMSFNGNINGITIKDGCNQEFKMKCPYCDKKIKIMLDFTSHWWRSDSVSGKVTTL